VCPGQGLPGLGQSLWPVPRPRQQPGLPPRHSDLLPAPARPRLSRLWRRQVRPPQRPHQARLLREWGFTEGIDNEGKLDGSNSYLSAGRKPRGPYLDFLAQRGLADLYVDEHLRRKNLGNAYVTALPDDAYCDNWLSENGLRFLRQFPEDQPWHLVVNFTGPHAPMDVTASMAERWRDALVPPPHDNPRDDPEVALRRRRYYAAMIENIDRQIGRFTALVEERGELDNTIVVFASDHGEMLGDHARWGKGTWHEPSSRIPLVVAGPGVRRGATAHALAALHDLAATFLDYAGAEPLPQADARSLRPLLEGNTEQHRQFIYSGLYNPDLRGWDMVVEGRWKLIRTDDAFILYDLESDPQEDRDLAPEHPDVVERLSRRFPPQMNTDEHRQTPLPTPFAPFVTLRGSNHVATATPEEPSRTLVGWASAPPALGAVSAARDGRLIHSPGLDLRVGPCVSVSVRARSENGQMAHLRGLTDRGFAI